ncbi:hypothetical protein ZWY2020_039301 [Hordeum vulgare]|nr:hypothetical protein ZWY2020_039301 [Hordeum vulgare]
MESGRADQVAGGGSGVDRLDRCSNIRQAGQGLVSNDIYYIWNHGPTFGGGFNCRYCSLINRGGATRFREHLGGIPGEVRECPNVPRNVRPAMRDSRDDARRKKREKKNRRLRLERDIMEGLYHGEGVINIEDDDEQIQTVLLESLRDKNVSCAVERRRGSGSGVRVSLGKQSITSYFDKELSSNKVSMQPKINTALNPESEDVLGQAWAKFFHANDIAAVVLDPYTHYQINMSNITDYASALTNAIEKIADPETVVLAIDEVSTYRECRERFGQRLARSSAEKMSPIVVRPCSREHTLPPRAAGHSGRGGHPPSTYDRPGRAYPRRSAGSPGFQRCPRRQDHLRGPPPPPASSRILHRLLLDPVPTPRLLLRGECSYAATDGLPRASSPAPMGGMGRDPRDPRDRAPSPVSQESGRIQAPRVKSIIVDSSGTEVAISGPDPGWTEVARRGSRLTPAEPSVPRSLRGTRRTDRRGVPCAGGPQAAPHLLNPFAGRCFRCLSKRHRLAARDTAIATRRQAHRLSVPPKS